MVGVILYEYVFNMIDGWDEINILVFFNCVDHLVYDYGWLVEKLKGVGLDSLTCS